MQWGNIILKATAASSTKAIISPTVLFNQSTQNIKEN